MTVIFLRTLLYSKKRANPAQRPPTLAKERYGLRRGHSGTFYASRGPVVRAAVASKGRGLLPLTDSLGSALTQSTTHKRGIRCLG